MRVMEEPRVMGEEDAGGTDGEEMAGRRRRDDDVR
jgi:hypothetical protein